ncbi:MAG: hypothetical protein WBP82_00425, partial [Leuconostoc mesenteroides]
NNGATAKAQLTADLARTELTNYKTDADGRISKAQSDITQTAKDVTTKVSQSDYNTKTGELTTNVNNVTQTANQSKQDIVAIKQTDTSQDSRMNTIESDASGTKQTVSNIQTKQGQQDASITTLQTRADGIETNVSKTQTAINDLQQINQITNSEFTPDFAGWHSGNDQQVADETSDVPAGWYRASGRYNNSTVIGNQLWVGVNSIHTDLIPVGPTQQLSGSAVGYSNPDYDGTVTLAIDFAYYDSSKKLISSNRSQTAVVKNWTKIILQATTPANTAYVSFAILTNGSNGVNYYSQPMLVFSNTLGSYVQGTYNNNGATAKAQLTADLARTELTNYKTDADGRISKAQSDITQTAKDVTTKVSQTDYNTKTGKLQTDLTTTTQTANQAKTDIVSIKQKDGDRDARMTQIESDASGVKTTVSDLSTTQGKQSGDISILQQRADGFETTVTKVDNLAVGGRNLLLNSAFLNGFNSWGNENNSWTIDSSIYQGNPIIKSPTTIGSGSRIVQRFTNPPASGSKVTVSFNARGNDSNSIILVTLFNTNTVNIPLSSSFSRYTVSFTIPNNFGIPQIYFWNNVAGNNVFLNSIKVDVGNVATDWTPAPEDGEQATAKAQLTADNAALAVGKLTSADGVITKAQADIRANADAITKTVSKTVYDQKTGDLTQAISKAQSTADGAVSTVGNYQTSNDQRVKSAESKIEQNSNDITARVIKTDYDDFKASYKSTMSEINSTFDRITSTVSETETTVNKLNQNNLVNNSQLNPDYSGWHATSPWGKSLTNELTNNGVESNSGAMWVWHNWNDQKEWIYSDPIAINQGSTLSGSVMAAMPSPPSSGQPLALYIRTYDANKTVVNSWSLNIDYDMVNSTFKKFSLDNKVAGSGARYVSLMFAWNVGGRISFGKPMLVFGTTTGDYVAGPYNNNDKIASQQITIDGITNIVSDPKTGLSTRVQTAEGTLNTVKS